VTPPLARVIERFADLTVLVIGDAMLDSYLEGSAGRLCREAPVPIVALCRRTDAAGGAANTAANVQALGARARLLPVLGDDGEGARLRRLLGSHGVGTEGVVTEPGRRTLAEHRLVADGQRLVRYDDGTTGPVTSPVERALVDRLDREFAAADAVIVSDYATSNHHSHPRGHRPAAGRGPGRVRTP
jgi:D-beta-D-heptose 7-phosphate kinase/D-beta-D-heptose 1-phosphate adenosyltransferase